MIYEGKGGWAKWWINVWGDEDGLYAKHNDDNVKMIMDIDNEDKYAKIHKIDLDWGSRYPLTKARIDEFFYIILPQGRSS